MEEYPKYKSICQITKIAWEFHHGGNVALQYRWRTLGFSEETTVVGENWNTKFSNCTTESCFYFATKLIQKLAMLLGCIVNH